MEKRDFREVNIFFEKIKKYYDKDLTKALRTGLVTASLIQKIEGVKIPSTSEGRRLLSAVYALLAEGYIKQGKEEKGYSAYKNGLGVAIGQSPQKNIVLASTQLQNNLKSLNVKLEKLAHFPSGILRLRINVNNQISLANQIGAFLASLSESEALYNELYFDMVELAVHSTFDIEKNEEYSFRSFLKKVQEMLKKKVAKLHNEFVKVELNTCLKVLEQYRHFFQLKDIVFPDQNFIDKYFFYLSIAELMLKWGYEEGKRHLESAEEILGKDLKTEPSLASAFLSVRSLTKYNSLNQKVLSNLIEQAPIDNAQLISNIAWRHFRESYNYNGPIPQNDLKGIKLILEAEKIINYSHVKFEAFLETIRKYNNDEITLISLFLLAEASLKSKDYLKASLTYLECRKIAENLCNAELVEEYTRKYEKCLLEAPVFL
ncbi:MAG: hypothetical protein ACFFC7_10400 [Candidatus Hermodarchaeota archaeon]